MPVFEFTARNLSGQKLTGRLECLSRSEALEDLMRREVVPVSVKRVTSIGEYLPALGGKVKPEEIITFSRQFHTMLKAGIHLLTCLHSLRKQTQHPVMKKVIDSIHRDVSEGSSLSDAVAKHPLVFNEMYVSMIRVGEEGGVLDEVLERLISLLEHDAETKSALKQAVKYPLIVCIGLLLCFLVVTLFVLPRFSQLFARFEADLPLPTRILLGFNDIMHSHGIIAVGVVLLITFFLAWWLRTEKGKWKWNEWKLQLPVFGPLFMRIAITRFARTFAILEGCGVPVLRNLEIVADTVGNLLIAREIMKQRECVRMGRSIAEPIRESAYFPPMVSEMLAVGEASGSMSEVLAAVSDHYDREIRYTVKNLTTLIEPFVTLILGVFVLFMAIAVFMPMWKMTSLMRR